MEKKQENKFAQMYQKERKAYKIFEAESTTKTCKQIYLQTPSNKIKRPDPNKTTHV